MERTLSVAAILDRLGHEILLLKKLGAFEQAAGVQAEVVLHRRAVDGEPVRLGIGASDGDPAVRLGV